jgi:predicted transcriptional regulator
MIAKALKDVMERLESWPAEVQEELAEIAREMEAGLHGGTYRASMEELAGIDRGLKAAAEGRFASDEAVAAVLAKHRHS